MPNFSKIKYWIYSMKRLCSICLRINSKSIKSPQKNWFESFQKLNIHKAPLSTSSMDRLLFRLPLTKHPPEETSRKLSFDEERRGFPSNYAFAKRSTSSQSFVRYFHLKDIVNKWQAEWKKQQQHKKLFSTELSCTQE